MPYMAFCEWVLLGNWSAVKRGDLVLVFRMIKGTVSSTEAAELGQLASLKFPGLLPRSCRN